MFTLPPAVAAVLSEFRVLFKQQRSWDKAEQIPGCQGVWGLPFLSVLAPSPSTPTQGGSGYKSSLDWAVQMESVVSRWLQRTWICVGDGGYGNAKFGWACRRHFHRRNTNS